MAMEAPAAGLACRQIRIEIVLAGVQVPARNLPLRYGDTVATLKLLLCCRYHDDVVLAVAACAAVVAHSQIVEPELYRARG